jgi:glycosyltransferase involved in cell wall biosynthesis
VQNKTNDTNWQTNQQNNHILWLASWYPSQLDPLLGDFIQRQAVAVSMFHSLVVWSVVDDRKGLITHSQTRTTKRLKNLEENILYVYTGDWPFEYGYKYWKVIKLLRCGRRVLADYYKRNKKPIAIHTHIAMYMGLLGHSFSKKYGVPHIISEQWTAYLPEASPNILSFNPWSSFQLKRIFQGASAISAVSRYLLGFLNQYANTPFQYRIPNVVNGELFKPGLLPNKAAFLCISANSYQKNVQDILKAVQMLANHPEKPSFLLQIIHHPDPELENLVKGLKIESFVQLLEPGSHERVATYMAQANALILYSRYETFGCVVIEAQSCGLPVIASDIPVLREIVKNGENGWLVKPENPENLASTMLSVIRGEKIINPTEIRQNVLSSYGYSEVGQQFIQVYRDLKIIG